MNNYFIHTIELYRLIGYDDYINLHKIRRFKNTGNKILDEYRCTDYSHYGIIIIFRKCTENEKKKKGSQLGYKLILVINPSRLIEENTYYNKIFDFNKFHNAIVFLNEKIAEIFENIISDISGIDDFVLGRIDITKDIKNVSYEFIQEYILTLRRLPLRCGYSFNSELEESCQTFRFEDSCNIINDSRAIEFVIYNKHSATMDQKYPDDVQEFYKDTLRIELRCKRKFIKKHTKNQSTYEALLFIYARKTEFTKEIFNAIFSCDINASFLSYYWLTKIIDAKTSRKKKKKMLKLVNYLHNYPDKTLDEALSFLFPSLKTQCTLMTAFDSLEVSPLPIQSKDIAYMQSIASLLEFSQPSEKGRIYADVINRKSRGKLVYVK